LIAIAVLAILAAWAVSISTLSGVNLQIAENQRKADGARACAESGVEIVRYWLSQVSIPGDTEESLQLSQISSEIEAAASGISNVTIYPASQGSVDMTVPSITLDSADGRSFSATITPVDSDTVNVTVTGVYGSMSKTISANYDFGVRLDTVFDYGVATKGALSLAGNIELEGINVSVGSDVFIESENQDEALSIIGNSQIAGDVIISNPDAYVTLQGGQASIGGETGDGAMDHVTIGEDPPEFPTPDPNYFTQYIVNTVDSSTDTTADANFENIVIAAGTNPTFTGNVTLRGIVFIQTPNVVTFAGNAMVTGIIVGDGSLEDDSATNQLNFQGTVDSLPVTELPAGGQYDGIRDELYTFILAPGFHVGFGGNFGTLNGAIAGNGIEFSGNAGGIINGSVINYSDQQMIFSGNSDLAIDPSGITEIPTGFIQEIVLNYDPDSYSEVVP
jgi:hypothetical protein